MNGSKILTTCSGHGDTIWGGFFVCVRCHTVIHDSRIEAGQDFCSGCGRQLLDGTPYPVEGVARICCTSCAGEMAIVTVAIAEA